MLAAQFSDFDELAGHIADKLKHAKPHQVAVADFAATDGSVSLIGEGLASLLKSSILLHSKKIPILSRAEFKDSLEKHKLLAADLASKEALQTLAADLHLDYIVLGIVSTDAAGYKLRASVLRIPDGSNLFTGEALIGRSELVDSLALPFPPQTNYPIASLSSQSIESYKTHMPQCLYCPSANVANIAPTTRAQGTDIFKILVSPYGTVDAIQPLSLLGDGLDERAFKDIRTWRFKPATDSEGKPIAVVIPVEVTFSLH
jgi:hypothetical protein